MYDSILQTIKKMIGLESSYDAFDEDIIVLINSAMQELYQLGVGDEPFSINGDTESWTDYLGENLKFLNDVKTYIYYKVRLIFNPPSNSFVVNSFQDAIKETAWRICTKMDIKRLNGGSDE